MADVTSSPPRMAFTRRIRSRAVRRFLKHRPAAIASFILLVFAVVAIFAPLIPPFDPIQPDVIGIKKGPSAAHWLGTDELGRDLLSRLIYGARASLLAGVIPVALAVSISVPLGLLAGYVGGIV